MTLATLIRKHLIRIGLQFRGLVHYCHGGNHGCMKANMLAKR